MRVRRRRMERQPQRRRQLARPVISVGNLSMGGTGKSPVVSAIAQWLIDHGQRPAILSRGYARADAVDGVVVVSDGRSIQSTLDRSGDEPMMLARQVPGAIVCVSPDRHLAGTLAERELGETKPHLSPEQAAVVDRYVSAFERYDMDALAALLRDDVTMSMPPYTLWLRGTPSIQAWLVGRGAACRGSRLIPTAACASPAFGHYKPDPQGGFTPWSLIVLELAGDRIANIVHFLDTQALFPRFALPPSLPAWRS